MDTLAFGYALGAIPCARDFHPLDCAHAWHTKKGGTRYKYRHIFQDKAIHCPSIP